MAGSNLLLWTALGVCLVLFLAGLAIFVRAVRPRRTGDTPYCRRCLYNLTGAPAENCPECGASLTAPRALIRGERRIRRPRIVFGALLMLIGLAPALAMTVGARRGFNWRPYAPAGWLLYELGSGVSAVEKPALAELERRLDSGRLHPDHIRKLADLCLTQQAAPTFRPGVGNSALELLGKLLRGSALSEPQRRAFLENLIQIEMRIRPQWIAGNPSEMAFDIAGRSPRAGPFVYGRMRRLPHETDEYPQFSPRSVGGGPTAPLVFRRSTSLTVTGPAEITAEIDFVASTADFPSMAFTANFEGPPGDTVLHRWTWRRSAPVEVLPELPPGFIALVEPPPQLEYIQGRARRELALQRLEDGDRYHVSLGFPRPATRLAKWAPTPRVWFAFDILATSGATEEKIGTWLSAPRWGNVTSTMRLLAVPRGAPVSVVLRPNPLLAASTVDVTEIWGREIRLDDLTWVGPHGRPLDPPPKSLPTTAP
jgi:hypothetical protein